MTHNPQSIPDSPPPDSWVWQVENFSPSDRVAPKAPILEQTEHRAVEIETTVRAPLAIGIVLLASIVGLICSIVSFFFLDVSLGQAFIIYFCVSIALGVICFLWQLVQHLVSTRSK